MVNKGRNSRKRRIFRHSQKKGGLEKSEKHLFLQNGANRYVTDGENV